jgi:hypothetical protein
MNQIIDPSLKKMIKDYIQTFKVCNFQFEHEGRKYCHFLVDSECGHYGEFEELPFRERREFYRCKL